MPAIRLRRRRALSAQAVHLVFQAEFEHVAGQYLALGGAGRKRYYSIASAPRADRTLDLCVDVRGDFGQYLNTLPLGAEVEAEGPAGKMRLLDARRAALYFAAGTGIAPVRAILQAHLAANPDADARLFFGARARAGPVLSRRVRSPGRAPAELRFPPDGQRRRPALARSARPRVRPSRRSPARPRQPRRIFLRAARDGRAPEDRPGRRRHPRRAAVLRAILNMQAAFLPSRSA